MSSFQLCRKRPIQVNEHVLKLPLDLISKVGTPRNPNTRPCKRPYVFSGITPSSSVSSPRKTSKDKQRSIADTKQKRRSIRRVGLKGEALSKELEMRALKVSQKTLHRYLQCLHDFEAWAKQHHRKVNENSLDRTVSAYLAHLYKEDAEYSVASYLVYGLQLVRCKVAKHDFLVSSKLSLAGWRKSEPGSMRVPVPEEFLYDFGLHALDTGRLDIAVALVIQFDGYLRPSECLGLTKAHVNPPHGKRYPHFSLVIAPSALQQTTKTGKTDDSIVLGDKVHNKPVNEVMRLWLLRCGEQLFQNLSLSQFEDWCKKVSVVLRYKSNCVMPHVVRHAGASNDRYHNRRSLHEIQKRVRWAAKSSVARYERAALLLSAWKQADSSRFKIIESRSQRFMKELLSQLRQAGKSK